MGMDGIDMLSYKTNLKNIQRLTYVCNIVNDVHFEVRLWSACGQQRRVSKRVITCYYLYKAFSGQIKIEYSTHCVTRTAIMLST